MGKRQPTRSLRHKCLRKTQTRQCDRAVFPLDNPYHQACFEAAIDAMLIADDQGCYVDANPAACELFGLSKAALLGHCIADFAQAEFDFAAAWQAFLAAGQDRGEFRLVRPDGTLREVEYAATANVVPHYHLSILRDITDRKQLERQVQQFQQALEEQVQQRTLALQQVNQDLQATNQQLQAAIQQRERAEIALECAGDGMWDWDTETNEVYFSHQWKAMLGYADDEIGNTWDEWHCRVHPDDRDRVYAALHQYCKGQTPIYQSEHRFLTKAGTWKWILDRGKAVAWKPDGTPKRIIGTHVDITERKQLEAALQASQQKYQTLFEILPVGVSITDAEGNLIEANPASEHILGIPVTEQTQRTYDDSAWQIVDGNGKPMAPSAYASVRALQEQRLIQGQEQGIIRPDGSIRWLTVSAAPLPLPGYGVAIAYMDITDRKQTDAALRKSDERLRLALESAGVGYWDWDCTTNEVIWSASLEQMMGLAPGTFDQRLETVVAMMHPDDRQAVLDAINRSLETSAPYDVEFRFIKPDGTVRWAAERGNVVRDATGRAVRMMGVDVDITERKEAEVRLRQQEAEFRALAENTPDFIVRCDRQFRYLYVNPVAAHIHNLPASAILGKTAQDLGWPEPLVHGWQLELGEVFQWGQPRSLEVTLPLLPRGDLTLDARIVPEFDAEGHVTSVLVVARDITALKQAQFSLFQQADRERLLRQITQHIRESLNLAQILNTSVQEVRQLLQADRVIIYRFCPDWSGDVIAESVVQPWKATLDSHLRDPCFQDKLVMQYCHGRIQCIDDIHTSHLAPCHVELLASFDVRANLVLPILPHQTTLWGLICVHHCGQPHSWQVWEVDLLEQITDQLAIALQQSELHQQLQQWATSLEQQVQARTAEIQRTLDLEAMLYRITERVRNSLDEAQILETVVQELGQTLDLECCDTGIYNANQMTSTITHEFRRSGQPAKGITFSIPETTHYNVYTSLFQGLVVQFCDLVPCDFRQDYQYFTVLACAVIDDHQILGDLWLYRHAAFTPTEVQLVQQVSNQCAIALRQSRLYQAAQAQVTELERLNQLKDDFLSTVSHELRTPMSNIKIATQMLEITLNNLGIPIDESTPIGRYFHILQKEGQREINLINDLLDLSRVDAGTESLNPTPVELQIYLPHLAEPFVERTRQQYQNLVFQIPADLPPLTTDLPSLERIITELLNNACKYTPPQETITITAQATAESLTIRISNSGVEIPTAEYDRIFDRFYRIPNNDPWKHGGTGLGLALVKKLIERLGGNIDLESGDGQTTFVLMFPLTVA